MARQLQSVMGATLLRDYARVFGWPRTNACAVCGKAFVPLFYCTRCNARYLCGKACQAIDWHTEHKYVCNKISPCFVVRDFCTDSVVGTDLAAELKFKTALLGPRASNVATAVFATRFVSAGSKVMRMRPHPPVLSSERHPTYSIGTTICATRANCKWTVYSHAPRCRAYLRTTRAVFAGERLVVLEGCE